MANRMRTTKQTAISGKDKEVSLSKEGTKSPKNKKQAKASKKAKEKSASKQSSFSLIAFFQKEQVRVIFGLIMLFFTLFLFAAFVSFLFTHETDDDIFSLNLLSTLQTNKSAENHLGLFGVYFSFLFIKIGFGVASFGFLLLMFLYSINLIARKRLLPLLKTTVWTVAIVLWVSTLLAFLFSNSAIWLGGEMGSEIVEFLDDKIKSVGIFLLLLLYLLCLIVLLGGLKLFARKKNPDVADDTEIETVKETEETSVEENQMEQPKMGLWALLFGKKDKDNDDEQEPDMPILEKETTEVEEDDEKKNEIEDEQKFSKEKITVRTIELPEEPPVQDDVKDEPTIDDTLPMPPIAGEDILIEDIKPQQPGPMENETTSEEEPIEEKEKSAFDVAQLPPYDPRADLPDYQFPTTDMLEEYVQETRSKEQKLIEIGNNKQRIKDTLSNYGIEISSISATEGPTITMYEIVPAPGVRISKIKGLEDDIALSLSALGIRIIAPIPGKGTIGIEVPNAHPQIVPMKDVIMSDKFQNANKMALPVAIGKTISNEVFVFDLAKMPHVLMAGATGQGKSVGLNAVLTSLLYKKHPAELKFVLVDPKKVELTLYSKIERHYLAKLPDSDEAIITDTHKVVKTLTSLCNEMDQRYELLKSAQCRNIIEYNEKFKARRLNPENGHRFLPYIVLVFDEFADCIMTAGREVEQPIARLAQLARAIGIHLIIATQRPSVNIITGVIKANFPARIAFRVSSSTDSRTILDTTGAQNLIGRGDMLISTGNELTRVQCALVDTPEVEKICEFIGEQRGYTGAFHLPEVIDDNGGTQQEVDDGEFDPCFADAARMVVQNQQGSTSFLQRKLKLGYNRAGRIMDQLEREKIVGPSLGSKVREVYIKDEVALDELLKNLNLL